MKRGIALVVLVVATLSVAIAQPMGGPDRKFGQGVLSKLDLSDSQKVQIDRVSKPRLQAIEAIRKKALPFPERKKQIGEILRAMQADINSILTTSQRQQLAQLLEEARKRNHDRWHRRASPPPPQ